MNPEDDKWFLVVWLACLAASFIFLAVLTWAVITMVTWAVDK